VLAQIEALRLRCVTGVSNEQRRDRQDAGSTCYAWRYLTTVNLTSRACVFPPPEALILNA